MLRFSAEPISSSKLANHLNNIKSLSARGQPSVLLPQKEFSRSWEYRPKKKAKGKGEQYTIFSQRRTIPMQEPKKPKGKQ